MNDPYVYPGTNVLKNVRGITNNEDLKEYERRITAINGAELSLKSKALPKRLSLEYLQHIHKDLFQDVYPWAGQLRTVDISKGNSFAPNEKLAVLAKPIFDRLHKQNQLRDLPRDQFVHEAAQLLSELNELHPFREGNGRTQRELIRQISVAAGHSISWHELGETPIANISKPLQDPYEQTTENIQADRNIEVSIAAFKGDLGPMRQLLNPLVDGTDHERSRSDRFQSTGAERQLGRIHAKYRWYTTAELDKQRTLHEERKTNQTQTLNLETQLREGRTTMPVSVQQQLAGQLRDLAKQAQSLDKKLLVLQTNVYNETGLSLDEWFDRYDKDQQQIGQLQNVLQLTSLQQELVEALQHQTPERVAALTSRILDGGQDQLSDYVLQGLGERPGERDPQIMRYDRLAGQLSVGEAYKTAGIEMPSELKALTRDVAMWRRDQGMQIPSNQKAALQEHSITKSRTQGFIDYGR